MCTIILFHRLFDGYPLAVAANRDEILSRPAEGFSVQDDAIFAPKDLVHGGTWIGFNQHGVLAALTNRFGAARDPSRRSRGEIPHIALGASDANDGAQRLLHLAATDFNPFHALVADQRTARVVWSDGEALHGLILGPGVHVITERSFQSLPPARATRIGRLLKHTNRFDPNVLMHVLSDRHPGGIDSPMVDLEEFAYGTRSSVIAGLGPDGVICWESTERPSFGSFVDRSSDLEAFRITSGNAASAPS
jgi:uncharacterized protein with NRDE domain